MRRALQLYRAHHDSAQHHEDRLWRDVEAEEFEDDAEQLRRQGQPGVSGERVQVPLRRDGGGHAGELARASVAQHYCAVGCISPLPFKL